MRIAVNGRFLAAPVTGVQRFARELLHHLVELAVGAGDEVVLLLPGGVARPPDLPRHVLVCRGRLGGHAWEQLELPVRAARASADVLLNPANTAPLVGVPRVVVVHDVFALTHPHWFSPRFAAAYRTVVAPAVRRAAVVVTPTAWSGDRLAEALGLAPDRIRVAPQGTAPLDGPPPPEAVEGVRRRFGLPDGYLLAFGARDPRKALPFLLRAMGRWDRRLGWGEDLPERPALAVVGREEGRLFREGATALKGTDRARGMVARASGNGTAPPRSREGTFHLGPVEDGELRALYGGALALAFPSLGEGFGRPPLEALACGTRVVAAPYGAAREVLGEAAVLAPLREDAWVDALAGLCREPSGERAAKVAQGRRHQAAWRWEDGTAAVLRACRDAAARGRDASASGAGGVTSSGSPSRASGPATRPWRGRTGGAGVGARPSGGEPRVALVHDWLTGVRGGERVLEALLELFPDAHVFTLLHKPGSAPPAVEARPIATSYVQRLPLVRQWYRYLLPLLPHAVEGLDLSGYDLVVSSSHCVAKGVPVPGGVPHLCYCHSPMRYVWDQHDAYFGPGRAPLHVRAAMALAAPRLRRWDVASAVRVTRFVANSHHVSGRIRSTYDRESGVVHPPVALERFRRAARAPLRREDFYLAVSALVPYKRLDLAVDAMTRLGRRLVVVGEGPETRRLERSAGPTVTLTGRLGDDDVADLLGRCRAFVHPGLEDFGIAAVEAQAAGAPVIALGAGGALETIVPWPKPGATGVFFDEPTAEALADAVLRFESLAFDPACLLASARRFTRERFLRGMEREAMVLLAGAGSVATGGGPDSERVHAGRARAPGGARPSVPGADP